MTRRKTVALVATAALGVSALGVGVAGAASKNRIDIVGGTSIEPGESVTDNQHFTPQDLEVKSGATVKLANKRRPRFDFPVRIAPTSVAYSDTAARARSTSIGMIPLSPSSVSVHPLRTIPITSSRELSAGPPLFPK